jgi:hypothetical protein
VVIILPRVTLGCCYCRTIHGSVSNSPADRRYTLRDDERQNQPDPTRPSSDPTRTNQNQPDPVQTQPEPVQNQPEPTRPNQNQPEPTGTNQTQSEPTRPNQNQPDPTRTKQTQFRHLEQTQPEPTRPSSDILSRTRTAKQNINRINKHGITNDTLSPYLVHYWQQGLLLSTLPLTPCLTRVWCSDCGQYLEYLQRDNQTRPDCTTE